MARFQQRVEQFPVVEAGCVVTLGKVRSARAATSSASVGLLTHRQPARLRPPRWFADARCRRRGRRGGRCGRLAQPRQGATQALIHQGFNHVPGIASALDIPKGQGAVQQRQDGHAGRGRLDSVGEPLHLPYRAQRAEQLAGDRGFLRGTVVGTEVQIAVAGGQRGFAGKTDNRGWRRRSKSIRPG